MVCSNILRILLKQIVRPYLKSTLYLSHIPTNEGKFLEICYIPVRLSDTSPRNPVKSFFSNVLSTIFLRYKLQSLDVLPENRYTRNQLYCFHCQADNQRNKYVIFSSFYIFLSNIPTLSFLPFCITPRILHRSAQKHLVYRGKALPSLHESHNPQHLHGAYLLKYQYRVQ